MCICNDESEVCAHKQRSFNSLKSLAAFKEDGATCFVCCRQSATTAVYSNYIISALNVAKRWGLIS